MLAAASTPAFAAKTSNGGDTQPPTNVPITDKKPKFEQAKPAGSVVEAVNPPPPAFRPDVRVTHVNTINFETSRYYSFKVENIGIQTAHNIWINTVVGMQADTGDDVKKLFGSDTPISSLAMGESKEVMVICHIHMQPGYHGVRGTVVAEVPDDLNVNNNIASSN
jgi:hypothetical protein